MRGDHLKKAGIAAAIVLMPGGFVLGATLAVRYWRRRKMDVAGHDSTDGAGHDDPSQGKRAE